MTSRQAQLTLAAGSGQSPVASYQSPVAGRRSPAKGTACAIEPVPTGD
ncbi:MAG TPA: hypothetical protein VJ808_13225 [Gemmatimonadales bacterium]|nr:hypothetical protein [Gemmatimonadales bacterium]